MFTNLIQRGPTTYCTRQACRLPVNSGGYIGQSLYCMRCYLVLKARR